MSDPSHAAEETTTAEADLARSDLTEREVTVLVVAQYREDPERIGDVAIIPDNGSLVVLGRGAPDDEPRVRFFRPYPGRLEPAQPLTARALSRRQLELRSRDGGVDVRRVGRCEMRINGVACDAGRINAGDTIALRQELLLYCARRSACPAPLRYFPAPFVKGFGAPDAFGILGESPALMQLRDEIAFAAKADQHVLLIGDTGTGKELAARAIHRLSTRANRAFVARNAATLPAGLMDAEMFGNLSNYPNPGMKERAGLVGEANGGVLFLDEIGELPLELQAHLLRVLDSDGEYQRLGESSLRRSDFRLLAATNRDPSHFRADFAARFKVKVELPPLSERREDIPLLVRYLVSSAALANPELAGRFVTRTEGGLPHVAIDSRLTEALLRHEYAGNIRELDAILWKAMAGGGDVLLHDPALFGPSHGSMPPKAPATSERRARNRDLRKDEIESALSDAKGNVADAAAALGLSSRYALYRLLTKHGIVTR